jgi:hypothetical protein
MFLYPSSVTEDIAHRERKAYLIVTRVNASGRRWNVGLSIAGKAISTMIHSSGENDLLRIYFVTQRDHVDYNLAYIGSDFTASEAGEFDKAYMNALFDYAYQQARRGYPWRKVPPRLADTEE